MQTIVSFFFEKVENRYMYHPHPQNEYELSIDGALKCKPLFPFLFFEKVENRYMYH